MQFDPIVHRTLVFGGSEVTVSLKVPKNAERGLVRSLGEGKNIPCFHYPIGFRGGAVIVYVHSIEDLRNVLILARLEVCRDEHVSGKVTLSVNLHPLQHGMPSYKLAVLGKRYELQEGWRSFTEERFGGVIVLAHPNDKIIQVEKVEPSRSLLVHSDSDASLGVRSPFAALAALRS